MRNKSGKRKTSLIFWGLCSAFLGGVLWLENEAVLAFMVAGVVFGVAIFVTGQERADEGVRREFEKAWEETVKRLLGEENEITIRALVDERNTAIPYREFVDLGRILQKHIRVAPNAGFEGLFYCRFLLKHLSSCDLGKIEMMADREVGNWRETWWREWKEAWWSEVPSHLRKVLVNRFEAK